jgi:amino acid adenylation domain-containing protein
MITGRTNVVLAASGAQQQAKSVTRRLADLFHARVVAEPDRIAVVHRDGRLTYRELGEHTAAVAQFLRAEDVVPDDRVGLFVEPSADLVVAVWGVLCSGGAYVPLSPKYPNERVRYMVEDCRPRVVLTQEVLRDRLTALAPPGTRIVTLEHAERAADQPPGPAPRPDHLAYVIYTSGSTGAPKGVMIEHGTLINQMGWLHDVHGLGAGSVVLQKTPLSFDAAQWEVLAPACGATVVAGSSGLHRDPDLLIDTIVRHKVTVLQCVPTLLRALIDTDRLSECTSLRRIYSGGETLTRSLVQDCLRTVPWTELVNLYGPTECTINTSAHVVHPDEVIAGQQTIPIGTPARGTYYRILDGQGRPVPDGEVGELYIGGVQLARGYLGRPELTAERFVPDPFAAAPARLFRSGDQARIQADGTVQFIGRVDNQVKLHGFRVELDEIRLAIEAHEWVKTAAVIVRRHPRTGSQVLVACVELDPRQAVLMDQGNHGAHHQSKASRLQVWMQLSNPGLRPATDLAGRPTVALSGREPTVAQRREVFARKTYRYYDGGQVTAADLLRVLGRRAMGTITRTPASLDADTLGEILRWFGQFRSGDRLLPKYGYASPGALYATQLYLEISGMPGLEAGHYYYHPADHELVLIRQAPKDGATRLAVHFVGRRAAVEPVYRNNIHEVLEIETGHMVGLFEEILPRYGLDIRPLGYVPAIRAELGCPTEDYYTGSFEIVAWSGPCEPAPVDIYVQAHPRGVADLPAGQYHNTDGALRWISDELVLRKDVIAINQQVYDRAHFGITVVARVDAPWLRYVDLGRTMQRLSMNDAYLGFMSSGYSSESGNDLPSATKMNAVLRALGLPTGPSYFFLGGRINEEQRASEGMREDTVHMRGPAEMVRDDLMELLPDYMVPNKVVVFDALPVTANGKVDMRALQDSERTDIGPAGRPLIAPRTPAERRVAAAWSAALCCGPVSVHDDFFALGGNSLTAVTLTHRLNKEFGTAVPMQALFEAPTVAMLARRFGSAGDQPASRLIPLWPHGEREPVFCWPGLGGYPMNLRPLANEVHLDRPIYGVQAYGINQGEIPHESVAAAAAADVAEIRELQPHGPYTLWGYSFGARLAFDAAYQLEQAGERVENLVLLAPGAPSVDLDGTIRAVATDYWDRVYVAILLSVFAGRIDHSCLDACLSVARDDDSFVAFVAQRFDLDPELVRRIVIVVHQTFEPEYAFRELRRRQVRAPITIVKARGDDYSFLEASDGYAATPPTVLRLDADHYSMLRKPDLAELVHAIRDRFGDRLEGAMMSHINIKHFPVALPEQQQRELVAAVTAAVRKAFRCEEDVISIALEPVEKDVWNDRVYLSEIVNREELLLKAPRY